MATSGQTATTKATGEGSTTVQHLVQTEVPPKVLAGWLDRWAAHHGVSNEGRVSLRPHSAGSELLELSVLGPADQKLALIDLPDGDAPTVYRLGAQNFYVITRYNRSSFYASAVIDLADALRAARNR